MCCSTTFAYEQLSVIALNFHLTRIRLNHQWSVCTNLIIWFVPTSLSAWKKEYLGLLRRGLLYRMQLLNSSFVTRLNSMYVNMTPKLRLFSSKPRCPRIICLTRSTEHDRAICGHLEEAYSIALHTEAFSVHHMTVVIILKMKSQHPG